MIAFAKLQRQVEAAFVSLRDDSLFLPSSLSLSQTGVGLLYHNSQESLLQDMAFNFLVAFALICLTMLCILRSLALGLITMLPNAFPALVLFGGLGWVHYPVDQSIAIMACVAIGIAVDDTTHFVLLYCNLSRARSESESHLSAMLQTISQCAPAMTATTIIIVVGFLAFLNSEIAAMTRFALSLTVTLFVALICDLLLLPALLQLVSVKEPENQRKCISMDQSN